MVLVDSSIWIAFEHGRYDLFAVIGEDEEVATCPIVLHEILRGTRNTARYELALEMLANVTMLDSPTPLERFEQAARLYLDCREHGVTPSSADCLVAACAITHGIPLLHADHDFDAIARCSRLEIFTRSAS
ncbi:MAG TPA: PIN domain nuclease [Thermoanaerobaculia bacterium]|nr:PIN domain nuclease [Thermoanaerobaculia bacterium]